MLKSVPIQALLLILLSVTYGFSLAADSQASTTDIKIALNEIPGVLESEKSDLPYNKLLLALNNRVIANLSLSFHPASRAAANFNSKKTDCLFPGSLASNIFADEDKIESKPINTAKAYFISDEIIDATRMVEDKDHRLIIGYRRGNTYGTTIEKLQHHRLFPLNSDKQAADMLNKGRIDIVLAYMPDSLALLKDSQGGSLKYAEQSLFYTQNDSILCHDTPSNREVVADIDDTLKRMKESGELQSILGKAYIE